MTLFQDICPFRPGLHRLSVIFTDLTEAEALVREMARDAQAAHPEDFAGKSPCVYCKMPYIPPCESFGELRKLILRIRENTGLRAHFRGLVAIEVTQWLGHENEEYFTVLLKYLYDHRDLWQGALVLTSCTEAQARRFLTACAGIVTPRLFDAGLFSRGDRLREVIRRECAGQGKILSREGAELLTAALTDPKLHRARSLSLIRRTAEELAAAAPADNIRLEDVREYLAHPDSLLTMLAGRVLTPERSSAHGTEMLQL